MSSATDLDLVEFNEWLEGYINFERKPETRMFRLETIQILCEALRHPEKACPCFHVAGSKGKGTISANIAAILREAGYKTGVLMSPHVSHFVERVGTGEKPFVQEIYDQAFRELKTAVEKLIAGKVLTKDNVSWFELTTTFAMLCFRAAKVDFAVFEVGMGGRLDATNIIEPLACAFGPIELEHTKILGNNLEDIALEKAGIIKTHVPCVSSPQKEVVKKVLEKVAEEHDAEIVFVRDEGDYLTQDARIAQIAVQKVLPEISDEICARGAEKVNLPGRFEKILGVLDIPYILIDVAHTENSVEKVLARMKIEGVEGKLLFGCGKDKNVEAMARKISESEIFSEIFLTKHGDFKKSDLEKMHETFVKYAGKTTIVADQNYRAFIPEVLENMSNEKCPLIVLGSFYLAGEVKKIIGKIEEYEHQTKKDVLSARAFCTIE